MSLLKRSWFGKLFGGIELILGLGKGYDSTNDVRLTSETLRLLLSGQGVAPTDFFDITIDDDTLTGVVSQNVTPHDKWMIKRDDSTTPVSSDMKTGDIDSTVILPTWDNYTYYLFKEVGGVISEVLNLAGESGVDVIPRDTLAPIPSLERLIATDENTQVKFQITSATDPVPGSGNSDVYDLYYDFPDDSLFLSDQAVDTPVEITVGPGFSSGVYARTTDIVGNVGKSNSVILNTLSVIPAGILSFDSLNFEDDEDAGPLVATGTRGGQTTGAISFTVSTLEYLDSNGVPLCKAGTGRAFNTGTGVDGATERITTDAVHNWQTDGSDDGIRLVYAKKGGSAVIGLTDHLTYFLKVIDADEITLHTSQAEGISGANPVNLTSNGTDTHYLYDNSFEGKVAETINVADGVNLWTVSTELVNRVRSTNDIFGIQIDFDSQSAGVEIGAIPSILCKINSSGTASTGAWQEVNDGTRNIVSIEIENYDTSTPDGANSWALVSGVTGASGSEYMSSPTSGKYGDATTVDLATPAPNLQFDINFITTNAHYIWLRGKTAGSTASDTVHVTYNDASVATALGVRKINDTDPEFTVHMQHWTSVNASAVRRQFTPAVGDQTVELYQYENGFWADKLVLTDDVDYDPGLVGLPGDAAEDEGFGPTESGKSATVIIDNPDNPTDALPPLPVDTITPTLFPLNGEQNVVVSSVFRVSFPGSTGVVSTSFEVSLNGSAISGTVATTTDSATFTPTLPLQNGVTYTITAIGSVVDDTNTDKSYDTTGVWTVDTIASTVTGDLLINVDFNDWNLGVPTQQNFIDSFNWDKLNFSSLESDQGGNVFRESIMLTHSLIVPDPLGDPNRGNVYASRHLIGEKVGGMEWRIDLLDNGSADYKSTTYDLPSGYIPPADSPNFNSFADEGASTYGGYDDVYLAFDILIPTEPKLQFQHKVTGLIAGTLLQASHDGGFNDQFKGIWAHWNGQQFTRDVLDVNRQNGSIGTFWYDAQNVAKNDTWSAIGLDGLATQDITSGSISYPNDYVVPNGRWITIEQRIKLNTAPTATAGSDAYADLLYADALPPGTLSNGLDEVWITDPAAGHFHVKVMSVSHAWRRLEQLHCNGVWFLEYMNDSNTNPQEPLTEELRIHYDNIRLSTSPITGTT